MCPWAPSPKNPWPEPRGVRPAGAGTPCTGARLRSNAQRREPPAIHPVAAPDPSVLSSCLPSDTDDTAPLASMPLPAPTGTRNHLLSDHALLLAPPLPLPSVDPPVLAILDRHSDDGNVVILFNRATHHCPSVSGLTSICRSVATEPLGSRGPQCSPAVTR